MGEQVSVGCVAAAVVLNRVLYGDWSESAVAESQATGDEIIAALRRYRDERGTLPPRLSALVPGYLNKIHSPVSGNGEWIYKPTANGTICLSFQGSDRSTVCFYCEKADSPPSEWYIDTR